MDALKDAVAKILIQLDEIRIDIGEIKETIGKQRIESIERLNTMEASMRDQHIKLDAFNAIDVTPTLETTRVVTVKVASKKKPDDEPEAKPELAFKTDDEPKFNTITDYFKHIWQTNRELLYEKGVYSQKEYDKLYEDNREEFDKKKKNELTLQRSIATRVWRVMSDANKDIVKAMRNQHANDLNKKASKDVEAEA